MAAEAGEVKGVASSQRVEGDQRATRSLSQLHRRFALWQCHMVHGASEGASQWSFLGQECRAGGEVALDENLRRLPRAGQTPSWASLGERCADPCEYGDGDA